MKKLILLGGPIESDRIKVAQKLNHKLSNSMMFEGSWCTQFDPTLKNPETFIMILNDIHYLLNSFLENSKIEHVVFSWIMDEQEIIEQILSGLNLTDVKVIPVSLVPSIQNVTLKFSDDSKQIDQIISRLLKYQSLATIKYDNTNVSLDSLSDDIIGQV